MVFDVENRLWKYDFGIFQLSRITSIYKIQHFPWSPFNFWLRTVLKVTTKGREVGSENLKCWLRNTWMVPLSICTVKDTPSKKSKPIWCFSFYTYSNSVFQNQDFSLVRNLWNGHVTIVKTTSSQMSIKKLHSFNGFFLDVSACLVKIDDTSGPHKMRIHLVRNSTSAKFGESPNIYLVRPIIHLARIFALGD